MNRPVANKRPSRAQLAEKSDQQLVAIARRQLPHVTLAYEVLMRRYQDALIRTCTRYLNSVEDAEEVVHEVMLKVFHGLARFKGESSFKTWLYRIAHNESMTCLRKRKVQLPLEAVNEDDHLAILLRFDRHDYPSQPRRPYLCALRRRKCLNSNAILQG